MSLQEAHTQKTPWDQVSLSAGIFSHLKTTYSVKDAVIEVVSELKALLDTPVEEALGVMIAYKDLKKPETQEEGGGEQANISFSPYPRNGNSMATSALLDIFHNTDINVMAIDPPTVIDDTYHYISYVCKDGNIYELDGGKQSSVLISKVSDSKDEKANWIKPFVDHLEKEANDYSDFSCAVVMRQLDYHQEIKIRREKIMELGDQLMEHVTSKGRAILKKIQRLNDMIVASEAVYYPEQSTFYSGMDSTSTTESEDSSSDIESIAQFHSPDDDESAANVSMGPEEPVTTEQSRDTSKNESPESAELEEYVQQQDLGTSVKRKYDDDDDDSTDKHSSTKKRSIQQGE